MSPTAKTSKRLSRAEAARAASERAYLEQVQRGRLITAIIEVSEAGGYAGLTVGQVIARAKVSRKSFYSQFANREEGFVAALSHTISRAASLAAEAFAREPGWRRGIRAGLEQLLACAEEQPDLARLWIVDTHRGGKPMIELRTQTLGTLAQAVDRGRACARHDPPAITAEAIVGGIIGTIHARLLREREPPLLDLIGQFMSMITLPYLGARVAGTELNRAVRRTPSQGAAAPLEARPDPLEGMKIRLTYRTVRVLTVIAANPGSSNREVALGAGIGDQGQISRLLKRLLQMGLVENLGVGQPKGGANAWRLTLHGESFQSQITLGWGTGMIPHDTVNGLPGVEIDAGASW